MERASTPSKFKRDIDSEGKTGLLNGKNPVYHCWIVFV
jgi:hypothetical protein